MKKIIYFIICYSLLTSCSNSDNETKINSEEVGEWKIVEVFSDIGNGTGSYNPVEQNKFIVFKANGSVTSNINYCNTNTNNDLLKIGTFNPNTKQIKPLESACLLTNSPIDYEIVNNHLILTYQSIETYREKYEFIVLN
jgi:hypothetical protein